MKTTKEKILEVLTNHPQGLHSGDLQRMSWDVLDCEAETCARRLRELRVDGLVENYHKEGYKGRFWRLASDNLTLL